MFCRKNLMSTLFHPIFRWSLFFVFYVLFLSKINGQINGLSYYDLSEKNLEFPINSDRLLLEKGGGKVFQYSCDSITRIDHSFSFKTRYGSLNFVYKNELYSFGGYGIFQFNNSIIRFYRPKGTWELFFPNSNINAPTPRRFMLGGVNDKKLYVGLGTSQEFDPKSNKVSDRTMKDFWVFDFESEKWSKLLTPENVKKAISNDFRFFNLGSRSYILGNNLMIYDFEKEEILAYNNHKSSIFHNAVKLEDNGDDLRVYYENESINLPKSSLLGSLSSKQKIQLDKEGGFSLQVLLFFGFILIFIILRLYYLKMRWKKSLNPHQIKIIKHIQNNNHSCSFKSLYDLYPNDLSHETLKGKLRKDLEIINHQYYLFYRRDLFSYGVDSLDKRMKTIRIKRYKIWGL